MRGVSTLLALLLVLCIALASAAAVARLLVARIGAGAQQPRHALVVEARAARVSEHSVLLRLALHNPSGTALRIRPLPLAHLYLRGFSEYVMLRLAGPAELVLPPGRTGKLELLLVTTGKSVGRGVLELWLAVEAPGGGAYYDVVLVPLP